MDRNGAYAEEIARRGHTIDFGLAEEEDTAVPEPDAPPGSDEETSNESTDASHTTSVSDAEVEYSELSDLLTDNLVIPKPKDR